MRYSMSYAKLDASALAQIGEGMRYVREGLMRRMRRTAGLDAGAALAEKPGGVHCG
jgi:hypothetical protein